MAVVQGPDQPDAVVYRVEAGARMVLCVHCLTAREMPTDDLGYAFDNARNHLWSTHGIRRTWVEHNDARYREMVNRALPIVLVHNTTRHR